MARAGRWLLLVASVGAIPGLAFAQHSCDALGDKGWRTVPTVEIVAQTDGAAYKGEEAGSWVVDRSTTVLPFCNYYNAVGNYSLRSYSLSPEQKTERVEICRADAASGVSVAVSPYAGRCPPG